MAKRFLTTAELSKIKFNQSSDAGLQQGEMIYDSEHLALMFGLSPNVKMELGQSTVILVYNDTLSNIPAGKAVYGVGVQNERPSVVQSTSATPEQSSRTFGVTAEVIPAGGSGWVVTQGILNGIDTSSFVSGDELWLSPTTPGLLVTTPAGSPNHDLLVGYCTVSSSVNGSIYVSFYRGVDIDGIHDIVLSGLAGGDILRYNSASGYWQNEALSALGGGATVSETPPSTPSPGDIWFNSSTAETFIYYDSTWVEVGEGGGGASGNLTDIENIAFNTSSPFYAVGVGDLSWDDGEGTLALGLKGGNVTLQLGQENVALCYNGTGSPIAEGAAVYISGAQGQRPSVTLAQANSEATSSKVLGIATETIANGAEGFVATFGIVNGLNTSGFTAGQALWLSASVAGGITATKPVAPNHLVFIGYAISINASSGRIFVNPQNGYEMDELHDVLITSKTNKDVLMYNSASGLWINEQINLGTDTVGDYVASVGGTDGVSISGTGEGAAVTIANSDKGSSQNIFKNITDGSNTASAEINNDTFTLTASTGMGIVVNATTDTATFVNTGVTSFSADTTGLTPSTGTTGAVTLGGTLAAANGGTGQSSYAVGDILYASTTSALSKLAGVATGNALISGGVNTAPSWGKIGLGTHISGTLGVANGGTGLSASATNGQLLIGNGTGYTLATLTQGTGITVTNGSGTISIANAGVTALTGTANEVEVSASTGSVTIGLPNDVTIGNNLTVTGTLTVNGTTTTVNSTTMTVDDPIITLGGDTAPISNDAKDRGIEFRYFDSAARLGFMGWDNSASSFVLLTSATNTSEVFTGTKGTLDAFISGSNINAGTVSATYIDSAIARLASPTFTGTPAAPTAAADTNTTQIATTAYVVGQAGSASPLMNGAVAVGTSLRYSRQDHVHPVDTSRAPTASPTFTGTITTPLTTAGYVTTTAGGVLGSVATIPNAGLTNSSVTIGSTAVSLGGTASTIAGLTLTSPTIDTVVASAASASPVLWSAVTTGTISIGAGLTTGTLNIGAAGTGATPINIGHTNATITLVGSIDIPILSAPALATNASGVIAAASTTGSGTTLVLSASPALTGTPTAPTATAGTNTTQIATTAFVQTAVGGVTGGAAYQTTAPVGPSTGDLWVDSDDTTVNLNANDYVLKTDLSNNPSMLSPFLLMGA